VLWTVNGVPVCRNAEGQVYPRIISNGGGSAFITWEDYRNSATQSADVYASQLRSDGTLGGSAPLPVRLVKFEARKINAWIQLHWRTASEQNSLLFNIERSNGANNFVSIGTTAAAGNSQSAMDYYFIDSLPLTGANHYRLKQVDIDGSFVYSITIPVSTLTGKALFTLFPNPATTSTQIIYTGEQEKAIYSLYDNMGRLIKQATIRKGIAGSIETASLSAGIYFIRVYAGNSFQQTKLIKH
jgi:hypothetical protein